MPQRRPDLSQGRSSSGLLQGIEVGQHGARCNTAPGCLGEANRGITIAIGPALPNQVRHAVSTSAWGQRGADQIPALSKCRTIKPSCDGSKDHVASVWGRRQQDMAEADRDRHKARSSTTVKPAPLLGPHVIIISACTVEGFSNCCLAN